MEFRTNPDSERINDTMTYRYIPAIGKQVTMKQFSDYSSRNINVWARMEVLHVDAVGDDYAVTAEVLNGNIKTGHVVQVPLSTIAAPIGWKERYEITVAPDKVSEVLSWLARGVAVRQCHDLSTAGRVTFQPADNCAQPHWAYPELTDVVPAEQTKDRIRIVQLESHTGAFVMRPCRYCKHGKRTRENNPLMHSWDEHVRECPKCGNVIGFHFDRAFHDDVRTQYEQMTDATATADCPEIHDGGWCFVCRGTGMAAKYISETDSRGGNKSERAAALAELRAAGWKVWYQRNGYQTWIMERAKVVKDWGSEPSN